MHGHVAGLMGQGFPAGSSQVATEKATQLQRTAGVRRRLLREASEMDHIVNADAAELVSAWKGSSGGSGGAVSRYV